MFQKIACLPRVFVAHDLHYLQFLCMLCLHVCMHVVVELLWRRKGHPVRQPPGSDVWDGVPYLGPLRGGMQPLRLRGGAHQHRGTAAVCH